MPIKFKKYWRKSSLKSQEDGNFLLNHINNIKPRNFLEIGVFHGVTSKNVCELLSKIHSDNFEFTGIDIFSDKTQISKDEFIPESKFSNPLKNIYYRYIAKLDPYSFESVIKLLSRFEKNINIVKGDSNVVLKEIDLSKIDYVFLDGGHKFETVKNDLER